MSSQREPAKRLADIAADSDLPDDLDDTRVCYWRSPAVPLVTGTMAIRISGWPEWRE